jgi:hypothetical protein
MSGEKCRENKEGISTLGTENALLFINDVSRLINVFDMSSITWPVY